MHLDLNTIVSTAVGGLISLVVSWFFYKKSGEELKAEAAELRRLNIVMLRALQIAGLVDVDWRKDGTPENAVWKIAVGSIPSEESFGTPTVRLDLESPPPVYDRQHENPSE
jgi:hypothetical protein